MSIFLILVVSVFLTSLLSGVFAMGGGVILLAVMVNLLPVTKAMVYHGVIQFAANLFRAMISYRHISPKIMLLYTAGSLMGSYFLLQLIYQPNKALILLCIGLITLTGPYLKFVHIDITKPWGAVLCGVFISWLNTLVGASGPLLNMFFLKSDLNRFEVIATKSATQSLAHLIKIFFYTGLLSAMEPFSFDRSGLTLILLCSLTFLGGWIGKKILDRMSEKKFRRYGYGIISTFGLIFTVQGLYLLFQTP